MSQRVLVIDDERGVGESVRSLLADDGVACELAEDALHGLKLAEDPAIGAVLLGLSPAARGGIETLRALRERRPALRVIVLGAATAQDLLLEALRRGAADYLAKPIHEEELRLAVRRALDATQTATRFESLRAQRLDATARGRREPEQHRTDRRILRELQPVQRVVCERAFDAVVREQAADRFADAALIVDHEHALCHRGWPHRM